MDLFESINEVAVLGCSLLMSALFVLWYTFIPSPSDRTHNEVAELSVVGISFLLLISMLAYGVSVLPVLHVSPVLFALGTALFGALLLVPSAFKEGNGVRAFLRHAGFIGIFCIASVAILTYWPW